MPEEAYEVSVSVPQELVLNADEKAELKQKFRADIIETLEARSEAFNDVAIEIVGPGGTG